MLRFTASYLVAPPDDALNYQRCAHLESFLMHVRNLWDFLTNNGRERDDVLAKLYNENGSWRPTRVPSEVKSINKHVAHITTKRLTDIGWHVAGLETVTLDGFAEFVTTVTPERQHWFDWFQR